MSRLNSNCGQWLKSVSKSWLIRTGFIARLAVASHPTKTFSKISLVFSVATPAVTAWLKIDRSMRM